MKSTGITRKVDELGRIVIPKELRKNLNINIKDSLEIYTKGNQIILEKFQTAICTKCAERIDEEDNYCRVCGNDLRGD